MTCVTLMDGATTNSHLTVMSVKGVLCRCSYPYGGHVPVNVSKIHASVANFSAEKDNFVVRVVVAGSVEDAARYVRTFAERAHSSTKVRMGAGDPHQPPVEFFVQWSNLLKALLSCNVIYDKRNG